MIALWVVHTLWTGMLLLLAARLLESGARGMRLPVRWVWVAALVATLGLGALAAYSTTRPVAAIPVDDAVAVYEPPVEADRVASPFAALLEDAAAGLRQVVDAPAMLVRAHATGAVMQRAGVVFGALWLAASLVLAGVLGVTLLRERRARRAWPREVVAGERVRVAPAAGPAVVGVLRPEIVVPAWLLDATAAEQRMVLAHEASHLRARDNLPLALSGLALVLLPWHPAVWWMAARLRLAVELDCDARVIHAGAPVRHYGDMLVDMATRRAALPLGSVALAETKSHLERRILAMTESTTGRALMRATMASAAAVMLVLAACEADLPTAAEVDAMDVADVEEQVAPAIATLGALYVIDGEEVDAEVAHALPSEEIAQVEVIRAKAVAEDGAPARGEIRILTKAEARRRGLTDSAPELRELKEGGVVRFRARAASDPLAVAAPEKFSGLLFIDGERVEPSALNALTPDRIERIEVLKGAAAARLYSEPEAANGVIQITTKGGGAQ